MTITSLDTHDFVNRLTSSGITLQHAEAHTKALTVFMGNELVRRTDLNTFKIEIRSDVAVFKTEMKSEFGTFKSEMRSEFSAFKTEMKSEFGTFKSEMRSEFNAFKTEMKSEFDTFRSEIKLEFTAFKAELDKKFCAIDIRFAKMQGEMNLFKWIAGFALTGELAIICKLFL